MSKQQCLGILCDGSSCKRQLVNAKYCQTHKGQSSHLWNQAYNNTFQDAELGDQDDFDFEDADTNDVKFISPKSDQFKQYLIERKIQRPSPKLISPRQKYKLLRSIVDRGKRYPISESPKRTYEEKLFETLRKNYSPRTFELMIKKASPKKASPKRSPQRSKLFNQILQGLNLKRISPKKASPKRSPLRSNPDLLTEIINFKPRKSSPLRQSPRRYKPDLLGQILNVKLKPSEYRNKISPQYQSILKRRNSLDEAILKRRNAMESPDEILIEGDMNDDFDVYDNQRPRPRRRLAVVNFRQPARNQEVNIGNLLQRVPVYGKSNSPNYSEW
jgi:hypothetical protein